MANEVIYNKQTVSGFAFDSAKGAYKTSLSGAFTLTAGQYYEIDWDGKTYTRKAYTLNGDSTVYIGNELRQKGEIDDITEPFIIAYVPGTNQNLFYAYDTSSSHIVGISTAEEPNSVLVKDWHGKDHEFTGHDTVYIRNAGGDAQPYTHGLLGSDIETPADFSGGDMVLTAEDGDFMKNVTVTKPETLTPDNVREGVTIAGVEGTVEVLDPLQTSVNLDFSDGDMEITPESGKAFTNVTIPVPAGLIPENIAEGVDIAGIIGALAAGGNVVMNAGTFTGTNAAGTITVAHGLGIVPDLFVAFYVGSSTMYGTKAYTSPCFIGLSKALQSKLGLSYSQLAARINSTSAMSIERHNSPLDSIGTSRAFSQNATSTNVYVGSSYCYAASGTYMWFAIGGLI